MAKFTMRKVAVVAAIAAAATFGLSACSTPAPEPSESAIGGDIVAPLELNYQEIDGQTVQMVVGQVANINYGGINEGEISVDIADPAVASYTPSEMKDGTQYSAAITALSGGETTVTFNFNGGDPKTLTVQVLLK